MPARTLPAVLAAVVALLVLVLVPAPARAEERPPGPWLSVADDRFRVHYKTDADQPRAERLRSFMSERVVPRLLALGFPLPPPDTMADLTAAQVSNPAALADPSGDGRYDLYLDPAQTTPGFNFGSFSTLRPDVGDPAGLGTAAHEYFHSVQFFIHPSRGHPSWMIESTAYWMGNELSTDGLGPAVISAESQGLFCGTGPGCPESYGQSSFYASFADYLQTRFGPTTVHAIFDRIRALDPPPWGAPYASGGVLARQALTDVLAARGTTPGAVLAEWAVASLFPAYGLFAGHPAEGPQPIFTSGRLGTTDVLDARTSVTARAADLGPLEHTVAPLGARFVVLQNDAPDTLTVTVERPAGGVAALRAYTTADGQVRDAAATSAGATTTFTVPGAASGRRLVHLVLANPGNEAATFRLSASARRPPAPPPPPAVDRTPPRLAAFSFTPTTLRRGRTVRAAFALSEAARVNLVFNQALPGRRSGSRCVRPTRRNARARKCTRYANAGTWALDLAAGLHSRSFAGRIAGRRLAPGSYLVIALPRDAAGNRGVQRAARLTISAR